MSTSSLPSFIKIYQAVLEKKSKMWKVYARRTDGRRTDDGRTDGRTDDGRCAMTIAHSSLWLRWAKKKGPKWQHIVYLSTICNLCWQIGQGGHLGSPPPKKKTHTHTHKLGRGRWDLASCQVSLNSIKRFQMRSKKCLSQSEEVAAILVFRSAWKAQTW